MRKHQVTFYSPGSFVSESSTFPIDDWNVRDAVELAESVTERYNAKPYGFVFETILTSKDVPDGEGGFLKVQPKVVNKSGIHFLGGRLETYDDVVDRKNKKDEILLYNMSGNDMWIICVTDNGWRSIMPFNEEDFVVNASGNIVEYGNDPKYINYRKSQTKKHGH